MIDGKLRIVLKQQTPMIHFQGKQSGATIRGSDLKPRLDKFLGIINEEDKHKYKVKIFIDSKVKSKRAGVDIVGDMKKVLLTGSKGTIFDNVFDDEVFLDIVTFDEKILESIKNEINAFFVYNNFGRRQTKGFGGFKVNDNIYNKDDIISVSKKIKEKYGCDIYYKKLKDDSMNTFFAEVYNFYSELKMGEGSFINEFYNSADENQKNVNKIKVAYSPNIAKIVKNNKAVKSSRASIEFRKIDSFSLIIVNETPEELKNGEYEVSNGNNNKNLKIDSEKSLDEIIFAYNSNKEKGYIKVIN